LGPALPLQYHDDFVGGDCAFSKNLPAPRSQRKVDDGGGEGVAGGASVDDERDAIADLVADAGGVGAFRCTLEVSRCRSDGQAEALDYGAGDCRIGDAEGDVAGVGCGAEGQLGSGSNDDGERAGPELVGQLVKVGVGIAGQFISLGEPGD